MHLQVVSPCFTISRVGAKFQGTFQPQRLWQLLLQVLKIYPFFPLFSTFIERRVTNWHAFLFSVPLYRVRQQERIERAS